MKKQFLWLLLALAPTAALATDDLVQLLDQGGAGAVTQSPLRKLISQPTAEQNIFFSHFDNGDFEKALFQFGPAFGRSPFAKTSNGIGLQAWLYFRNGLPLTGLDRLLNEVKPADLHPTLVGLWKSAAKEDHPAWNLIWVKSWDSGWTKIFGPSVELRVQSRTLDAFRDTDKIRNLLSESREQNIERARLQWLLAVGSSDKSPAQAAPILSSLIKNNQTPVSLDLMNLTAARLLFRNGYLDGAIQYYDKVGKASDYWFEAQEEAGWASLRKGRPQDTLSRTYHLEQPTLAWLSGPEASFLRALSQLKVCDYSGVSKTLLQFRDLFKERTKNLVALSKDANTPEVEQFLEKRMNGASGIKELGPLVKHLPRLALRDTEIGFWAKYYKAMKAEADKAGSLYARSLSQGSDRVGFQADSERLKAEVGQRSAGLRSAVFNRVKELAAAEVEETQQILSKMQIVEAEVLQQSALLGRVAKESSGKKTELKGVPKTAKNQIQFPGEDELWFDEISSTHFDIKGGCEAKKATK